MMRPRHAAYLVFGWALLILSLLCFSAGLALIAVAVR